MGLKKVDLSRTRRFVRGDDNDWINGNAEKGVLAHPEAAGDDAWIEVRTSLSGREDDRIADLTQAERLIDENGVMGLRPAKRESVNPAVFELMVKGWSLVDGKPRSQDYDELDIPDRDWINHCINEAIGIARGEISGNGSSPGKADPSSDLPNSSPSEASHS